MKVSQNFIVSEAIPPNKVSIRYESSSISPGVRPRGCAVVLHGRCEFIEKYAETADDLTRRGFATHRIEWRGHGLSGGRAADNPQKNHVADFDLLADDLDIVTRRLGLGEGAGRPMILLAHSMGGLIGLLHLLRHPQRYAAAIFCAPMWDIATGPWFKSVARGLTRLACAGGWGERYAFGQHDYDPAAGVFTPDNPFTSDPARFRALHDAWAAQPDMRVGGVTFGWLDAAFRAMDRLPDDPRLGALSTPVLILSAGDDRIVDSRSHRIIAPRLPRHRLVDIAGGRHELLMERNELRAQVWRAIDDFLDDCLNGPLPAEISPCATHPSS